MRNTRSFVPRRHRRLLAWALATGTAFSASAFGQIEASWINPYNGHWVETQYWSSNPLYPNNGNPAGAVYDVSIGAAGLPYFVTFSDVTVNVNTLELSGSNLQFTQYSGTLSLGTPGMSSTAMPLRITGGTRHYMFGGTLELATPERISQIDGGYFYQSRGTVVQRGHLLVGVGGSAGDGPGHVQLTGNARWNSVPTSGFEDPETVFGLGPSVTGLLQVSSTAAATFTNLAFGVAGGQGSLLVEHGGHLTAQRLTVGNGDWVVGGSGTSGFGVVTLDDSFSRINVTSLNPLFPGVLRIGGGSDGLGAGTVVVAAGSLSAPIFNISPTGLLDVRGGNVDLGFGSNSGTMLLGGNARTTVGACSLTAGGQLHVTNGTLTLSTLTIPSNGTQLFNAAGGSLSIASFTQLGGSSTISGPTVLNNIAMSIGDNAQFTLAGAAVNTQTLALTGGNIHFTGGTFDIETLQMTAGRFTLAPGADVRIDVTSLDIDGSAVLDIGDNRVTIDYSGPSPIDEVRQDVARAYAGGTWTGEGITSSLANGNTLGVGYADFANASIIIRLARYGDANLDGQINLIDFNHLAANFGSNGAVWYEGDFNYDGNVNLTDFNRLAANFGLSAGPEAPTPEDWATLAAAIPEPGMGAILVFGAAAVALRRRRPTTDPQVNVV